MSTIDKTKLTVSDLEKNFITVSEFQKLVVPNSPYQYARQIVLQNKYGLEVIEIEIGQDEVRRYISRQSVMKCIETRKHNKELRDSKNSE